MDGLATRIVCAYLFCSCLAETGWSTSYPTPPLPLSPLPSASQLKFQHREMALFFHFGMNTFTDMEWGDGNGDPRSFNPTKLDTRQWMEVARDAGFKLVILTVKHHDGFCLWQTQYSNYSVQSSIWEGGAGDVFQEFTMAARDAGLDVGFYLSPWDRHEETYGEDLAYNAHYMAQLRELLTRYGPVSEVWLDGAKGFDTRNQSYMFPEWFAFIHQHQPSANIFSDAGPDIRWVGNENGEAASTCWSMINRTKITIGNSSDVLGYLNSGDSSGIDWVPAECDVSIRPGWFWHDEESPKPLDSLLDIYFKSTGRNCVLLLNVPPNTTGLISEEDIQVLIDFRYALNDIFSVNLAIGSQVNASTTRGARMMGDAENSPFAPTRILEEDAATFWSAEEGETSAYLDLFFETEIIFNTLKVQEAVALGQRVSRYSLHIWIDGLWEMVTNGTTIGHKKLDCFCAVQTRRARLVIEEARGPPVISSLGLYLDTWSGDNRRCRRRMNITTLHSGVTGPDCQVLASG